MRAKDIFIKARELIAEEQHWTQGDLRNGNRYCILGACCAAAGFIDKVNQADDPTDAAEATFGRWLRPCIEKAQPRGYGRVFAFNDSIDTAHADVLAVLDCAIECTPEALVILEPNLPEESTYG